jgi:hypothetical protein
LLGGAGVGILPEGLVLSAALDSSDRAGADIGAQHEAVIVAQVVIEAQRVEARTLKDRKISHL